MLNGLLRRDETDPKIGFQLNRNQAINEKKIVDLMLADYSWEQVVYDIIASQGLDPWNLDLNILSQSFLSYMKKIEELDFRIPAKYVIISSVILRMKSDNMRLLDIPSEGAETDMDEDNFQPEFNQLALPKGFNMSLFNAQERRRPTKQLMVTDLIFALRKVMSNKEIREMKIAAAKSKIQISTDSIIERINSVYDKINSMLGRAKQEEVPFSQVVDKWERQSVVQHFLPLIYLENEKKVNCRQEEFFNEIYIKKLNNGNDHSTTPKKENTDILEIKRSDTKIKSKRKR